MLLLDAALAYIRAGLSVIPCRAADDANRPKAPALASWKVYQSFLATEDEARDWWPQHKALAVVCGAVSGNLEIIDFDDFDAFEAWHQIALHEAPNLLEALTIVGTPSGGRHVYYRCESPPPGNQKLARDTDGSTLIETRGEGGYALAPPSKGYELLESGVPLSLSLNNITDAERDVLLGVARSLDLYAPARAAQNEPLPIERVEGDPGTDFNTRGWAECASALTSAGWRLIRRTSSGHEFWCRPGKDAGVSATFNAPTCPGRFYVFSSNAGLDVRAYDPFGLYARLTHGGDFAAASRDLLERGYGQATKSKAAPKARIGGGTAATSTGDGQAGEPPSVEDAPAEVDVPYQEIGGQIVHVGAKGKVVCDFTARIVREAHSEDGGRVYTIRGRVRSGGAFECEIDAKPYEDARTLAGMLGAAAGGRAAVMAGMASHLPAAIKLLSLPAPGEADTVERTRRFHRVGWATIEGERVYLAPGREPAGVEVRVSRRLPMHLPNQEKLVDANLEAAQSALRALIESLGPERTTLVLSHLLAAPAARANANAQWADERYALMIVGMTGSLKTSFVQAALTLFGEGYSRDEALLRWGEGATANALMQHATTCADAPFFVDNFKPNTGGGSRAWVNLVHSIVEGGEKERLGRDSALREGKSIFAWPVFTGEDAPDTDAAATARTLTVRFPAGSGGVNHLLAEAQAAAHLLPLLGAAYVAWLESEEGQDRAGRVATFLRTARGEWGEALRELQPDMPNALRVATSLALNEAAYALACACPSLAPALVPYAEAHTKGLLATARVMARTTSAASEAHRLLAALEQLLAMGRVRLAERTEKLGQPFPGAPVVVGFTDQMKPSVIYLLPDPAIEQSRRLLGDERAPAISKPALYAQLERLGLVAEQDKDHTCVRIRVGESLQGAKKMQQVRVLALRAEALGEDADAPAEVVTEEDLPF